MCPLRCGNSAWRCFYLTLLVSFVCVFQVWHFYLGEPMTVLEIDPGNGVLTKTVLGADVLAGQKVQHVVRAGVWFGAFPNAGTDYR